jgi:hypothetical protein
MRAVGFGSSNATAYTCQSIQITDVSTPGDVPEPSSAGLLLMGFAAVEYLRRKSRE